MNWIFSIKFICWCQAKILNFFHYIMIEISCSLIVMNSSDFVFEHLILEILWTLFLWISILTCKWLWHLWQLHYSRITGLLYLSLEDMIFLASQTTIMWLLLTESTFTNEMYLSPQLYTNSTKSENKIQIKVSQKISIP